MTNEYKKMMNQEWYDANNDSSLIEMRTKVQDLCFDYNQTRPSNFLTRNNLLKEILNVDELPEGLEITPPLWVDYGRHIKFGKNVGVNADSYFMDGNYITIGDNTFIGPKCGFYANNHPENSQQRSQGLEQALPITIGKNVWLGANVTVLPGVTIGAGCIIGAGSVVSKDIPENSLAVGVPCKVVRAINEDEVLSL